MLLQWKIVIKVQTKIRECIWDNPHDLGFWHLYTSRDASRLRCRLRLVRCQIQAAKLHLIQDNTA